MAEHVGARRATFWTVVNVLVVVYALLPVLWILSLSLKPTSMAKDGKLIPRSITLENYKGIFSGDVFSSALINSIGIGLITTLVAVVIGGMAAYAVARLDFAGKRLLIGATLLIAMFPQISLVTPLFNIERRVGLFDTWPGLIIPYITFALPLAIYTLSAFFREIPWDLEKAAKMDGATPAQAFRRVIAPLAAPGIVTAAILVFIFAWNDLLLALSLTATPKAMTAPVAIVNFSGTSQYEEPTGSIAAGAIVITMAPAAIDPVGSSNCELPVKFAIATGAVIADFVAVSDNASSRSFQAKMKTRMAAVTIPGAASGAITCRNAWAGVAPSILAAFSRSRGISRKKAERV